MNYTDQDIIDGILQNNKAILNALYKMHFRSITNMVVLNGGDEQEAKDIYQEGIIVLYEKINSKKLVLTSSLKTYLYSVCRNHWLKQLERKSKYVGKIEDHEEYFVLDETESNAIEEDADKYQSMNLAMQMLGEPCKSLITDFYIKDLNMVEMTEKFGYTNADNTKNQKYKCMNRLKKLFFELYKK